MFVDSSFSLLSYSILGWMFAIIWSSLTRFHSQIGIKTPKNVLGKLFLQESGQIIATSHDLTPNGGLRSHFGWSFNLQSRFLISTKKLHTAFHSFIACIVALLCSLYSISLLFVLLHIPLTRHVNASKTSSSPRTFVLLPTWHPEWTGYTHLWVITTMLCRVWIR